MESFQPIFKHFLKSEIIAFHYLGVYIPGFYELFILSNTIFAYNYFHTHDFACLLVRFKFTDTSILVMIGK